MKQILLLWAVGLCVQGKTQLFKSQYNEVLKPVLHEKLTNTIIKRTSRLNEELNKQLQRTYNRMNRVQAHISYSATQLELSALPIEPTLGEHVNTAYLAVADTLMAGLLFAEELLPTQVPQKAALVDAYRNMEHVRSGLSKAEALQQYINTLSNRVRDEMLITRQPSLLRRMSRMRNSLLKKQQKVQDAFQQASVPERKMLAVLSEMPSFQNFFRRHSAIGNLFAPTSDPANTVTIPAGLQSNSDLSAAIVHRWGILPALNKPSQEGLLFNSFDPSMVGYKPDRKRIDESQSRVPLNKRLFTSLDMQHQSGAYLPVGTMAGVALGYRFNQKTIAGIGVAGFIGWEHNWRKMSLSWKGISFRSFVEYQIRKRIWIGTHYERTQQGVDAQSGLIIPVQFSQHSGLLGLRKEIRITDKRTTSISLLWDFVSYQQLPHRPPLVWRVAWSK